MNRTQKIILIACLIAASVLTYVSYLAYIGSHTATPAAAVIVQTTPELSVLELEQCLIKGLKSKSGAGVTYIDWQDGYYKGTTQSYVLLPDGIKYHIYYWSTEEGSLLSISTQPDGPHYTDGDLKGELSMASAKYVKLDETDIAKAKFKETKSEWDPKFREVLETLVSAMTKA